MYDVTTGIPGPQHDNTTLAFFLGTGVSGEENAESGLDSDVDGNNLVITGTVAIAANNDGHEGGLTLPTQFPHCQQVSLQFTVTVPEFIPVGTGATPTGTADYANLWIDWDRSGDWGENAGSCPGSSTGVQEWTIENMQLDLPGTGTYSFTTPAFTVWNPDPDQAIWVRITLAEQMSSLEEGAGPTAGYAFGETEDYLWVEQNTVYLPIVMGGGGTTTHRLWMMTTHMWTKVSLPKCSLNGRKFQMMEPASYWILTINSSLSQIIAITIKLYFSLFARWAMGIKQNTCPLHPFWSLLADPLPGPCKPDPPCRGIFPFSRHAHWGDDGLRSCQSRAIIQNRDQFHRFSPA